MRRQWQPAVILLTLLISSCGQDVSEVTFAEPWPDRIDLQVIDSIGVETGDTNFVFGAICDACFGDQSEILVLDQAGSHIRAYTKTGDFITRISRPGSGPGELSHPLSLSCLGDGRIFVLNPMDNSYEIFDGLDYSFLEEVALWGNNPPMAPCGLDGEYYLGLKFEMEESDGTLTGISTLGRFRMGEVDPEIIFFRDEFPVDLADLGLLVKNMLRSLVFTGDRSGRVFFSEMSTRNYDVIALSSDGTELFRITTDLSPVSRTTEEMNEEKAYMEHWVSRMGGMGGMPVEWDPEPFRWMIVGLGVDSQERLWVQRGTELMPVFDVFDMNGEHLFSASFPLEGLSWKFHIESGGMLGWEEDPESGFQKVYILLEP